MARVFIIGITGGIGSRLAAHLLRGGDQVVGLHRKAQQAQSLRASGVSPAQGDLGTLAVDQLADLMRGCDAVVFAAGASESGSRAADMVDGKGVELATAAAALAGIRHFLHVSAFPDAWRDRRMPAEFEHYMKVKRMADVHIAATALDWVIVRPGTLTDTPGTGRVSLGPAVAYREVPRDDVAAVLSSLVHRPDIRRVILELTAGDLPVEAAITRAVSGPVADASAAS